MAPQRGDRVAPPPRPGVDWDVRYADMSAVAGWEELCRTEPGSTVECWIRLRERPDDPTNHARQHRLKGTLGSRLIGGVLLEQWQYEVTGSGRAWYCLDPERRRVFVTYAGTGHPRQTA